MSKETEVASVKHDEVSQDSHSGAELLADRPEYKRLLRKVDWHVMPVVILLIKTFFSILLTYLLALHDLRFAILRQGASQSSSHIWPSGRPQSTRWTQIFLGFPNLLFRIHGRMLSSTP